MQQMRKHLCAICGDEKSAGGLWFLLAENRWEDKLKILQWDPQLARQDGIRPACSAAHVQELVVHWMTTRSLSYPFARVSSDDKPAPEFEGALAGTGRYRYPRRPPDWRTCHPSGQCETRAQ